jgi:radical SAM protein with 4Fe4S-binding SPASM domain
MNKLKYLLYKLSGGFSPLPFYLAVNIFNDCNRTCAFCPYHSPTLAKTPHTNWVNRQPKHLIYSRFATFLGSIGIMRYFIKHIAITGKGEPMMHPHFIKFCRLINSYHLPFSITTNGDFLHKFADKLSKLEYLTEVRVSIYDSGDIQKWINAQMNAMYPLSLFNQTGTHIDGLIDGYTVYCEGNTEHTMPKDFNTVTSCKAPFTFLTMNTDGSIVPCYSYHEVGNAFKDSFWKIWQGKRMREFRIKALTRTATRCDCKNCGINLAK